VQLSTHTMLSLCQTSPTHEAVPRNTVYIYCYIQQSQADNLGVALPPFGDSPQFYLNPQHCKYHIPERYILTKCTIKLHIKISYLFPLQNLMCSFILLSKSVSETEVCGITKLVLYIHYILYKFKIIFCLALHINVSRQPQGSVETGLACTKEHHLR